MHALHRTAMNDTATHAALDGPCLRQPDLGLEREHDSDVTLHRHN